VPAVATYRDFLEAILYDWWCTDPEEEFGFFCSKVVWDNVSFDTVGFYAEDDYNLVVILKNPMEYNFYLKYELCTNFFLVHPDLYKQCISMTDGLYTNNYGTSIATFIGYGPYKLTQYVADSTIVLERNLNWHGYSKAEYKEGTYQTNHVVYKKVTENATRLEMFLKGELDSYGLQEEDMEDYITSKYVVYTDSESTWYLAMNPQEANLATVQAAATPQTAGNAVIKTVLCIDDFRKALSYSLDREQFNLALSPTSGVAKALLSAMIVADPEQGTSYLSTNQAKDAILSFWGLSYEWG
jgi:ABC-type oligopeptide transport system substrate-binding subunit